jgi:hypothetical protein
MDTLQVVGFGFMSLVWVAFVVVTARPAHAAKRQA